jgi:hypothetical protein
LEEKERRFACHDCLVLLNESDLIEGKCPNCNNTPKEICKEEHQCNCTEEITGGTQTCPVCGEFTCPCGSHSAFVISRVTGYLADVGGWGKGKRAEFNDRTRYDVT